MSIADPTVTTRSGGALDFIRRQNFSVFQILSALIALTIVLLVAYPAILMIARVFFPGGVPQATAFREVMASPWVLQTILNTVMAVVGGGFFAIVTASVFAWLNERTDARLGIVGDIMPIVPLIVPTVAMAIGWIFLASPGAGFINAALRATVGQMGWDIQISVTSWAGVIFVYALYFVPYVYLIVAAAFRNVDPALEEASRLSGASMLTTLRKVSLPAIKPALIGASLLVVITGLSLYSIPVVIANRAGIDILSVRILRSLTFEYPARTDLAMVLSLFLMAAIATVWMIQRRIMAAGNFATIGGKSARHVTVELGAWKWPARALMLFYIACTSVLPLLALVVVSLQPFWRPDIDPSTFTLRHYQILFERPMTRNAMQNSIGLGIVGGLVGIVIAAIMALYVLSAPKAIGRIVDGVTKFPAALSHIVIGVGFLIAFAGAPFYLSGTLLLLFIVYIVIYLPEASIVAGASVSQVGRDLLEASSISGATQGYTFRRVVMPLILPGLISGWALLFVLMSSELTASALLASVRTPVVGFVIIDIWEQGSFGNLAALAFSFTVITASIVLIAMKFSRRAFDRR